MLFVACSRRNFDSAHQLNVNLSIPRPNNVHDFQLVGVHSTRHDRTLASIALSTTLVVPPYIGNIRFIHDLSILLISSSGSIILTLMLVNFIFTARCTLVQSAVLLSYVVCPSVRLSVRPSECDVQVP